MSDTAKPFVQSATLPTRANLEHLKNEAKQYLRELRRERPAAQLAEAQLAIARIYGFASWRKLKSYLDALHDFGQPLIDAVRSGSVETMRNILDGHPELVNASTDIMLMARPSDARTMRLLHLAIAEGKADALRMLIERGADLNVRNTSGRLPLHDCFELGHDDFAKILLDAGAVPDVCAAAAYGMHDQLRKIMSADPSLANDLTTGESPLGWSVYGAQPVSAEILFEHGAIVDRPPYDAYAWGPAAMVASIAVTPILLRHGASPNWRDAEGDTSIHRVLKSRIVLDPAEFVRLLIDAGADLRLRNTEGRNALDEALLQQNRVAETYFPVRPIGQKKLERTIEMLKKAVAGHHA